VVPGLLAATPRPIDVRKAFELFKDEGIDVVVTLTLQPLNEPVVEEFGFEYHHIPVEDFTAPSARQIDQFVRIVENARKSNRRAVVHCIAGLGRTGTMAACYLVSRGRSSLEALEAVRTLRPGSVETLDQERAIRRYAQRLKRDRMT
jgi:atypical dual specificity phosphatase